MQRRLVIAAALVFLVPSLLPAQATVPVDQRVGRQRITTLYPVVERVVIVLTWINDSSFLDSEGQTWVLETGSPITDKPTTLTGWVLPGSDCSLRFTTRIGRVFKVGIAGTSSAARVGVTGTGAAARAGVTGPGPAARCPSGRCPIR